ncbi:Di-copper centre-containing protein [Xylaria scruposa]|nr:Di-copper centre-containing protein [Xylaria scruposa]
MFNDGPMDKSGRWIDRPLAVLEEVADNLELHFEDIQEKIVDSLEELQVRDGVHRLKSKSDNSAKDILPFPDFSDFFGGKPSSQPKPPTQPPSPPPTQPEQPTKAPDNGKGAGGPGKTSGGSKETAGSSAATCDPSNPNVRFEWSSYSNGDRTAFVQAIKCLQGKPSGGSQFTGSTNRYEDLISVHRGMTANIHQTAAFLVWHRYFVWVFEQLLRNECGFNRAMPWWDETKHAGAFAASDVFTNSWFGNLPAKTSDGQGTCIESGEFAGTTLHVGPGNANENHCLSRAVDESQTAQCNQDFTNTCLSMNTYEEFRDCFELGPHGYGHNGIGAVMAEVSASVGDPVFFMHHLFVDHTFRIWQNANPSRKTTISGCATSGNPCTPITLDTTLSSNGLGPDLTVRQVMDTLSGTICYRYDY